jgi:hypothetical protein
MPQGWTVAEDELVKVVGPEKDLCVWFVVSGAGGSVEELVGSAWERVGAGLDLKLRQ